MHLYCYTRIEMNGSVQIYVERLLFSAFTIIGGNNYEHIEISEKYLR